MAPRPKPTLKPQARPKLTVELRNRWAIFHCPVEMQPALKTFFRYQVPGSEFSPRVRSGEWDGYRHLMKRGRVPAGVFLAKQQLLQAKYSLTVRDLRVKPKYKTVAPDPEERHYQNSAVAAMIAASATGGIVLCATGTGKTRTAAEYFRRLVGSGCFIVDELALLEQARKALSSALNESVGVVGRSKFAPERITVATIQTLSKHRDKSAFRKWFESIDALILDEIHLAINKRNADIIQKISPLAVFGLTATLEMQKPEIFLPVTALAGPQIFAYPLQQGVEEGFLSKGVVCCVQFPDPLSGRSPGYQSESGWIPSGSKDADYRFRISLNGARNRCIEAIAREGVSRGRRVIVIVERKTHLYTLDKRLADIPHRALCGDQSAEYRLEAMQLMDEGKLPLILATRVFGKGVDIRTVSMIIDGTALPGRNGAHQRYGRGTRKGEGKDNLWYVDIADLGNRFEDAARSRQKALKELGNPIRICVWKGNPGSVFAMLEPRKDL